MNIARQIFNNQHCTTELIDFFTKKYKINDKDHVFCWLCLNEIGNYYLFLGICELANHCCVVKTGKGFDFTGDVRKNAVLIDNMNIWMLNRK